MRCFSSGTGYSRTLGSKGIIPMNTLKTAVTSKFVVWVILLGFCFTAGISARPDDPEKDEPIKVKKLCKEVKAEYKNRKDRDIEMILESFDTFLQIYAEAEPKDQKEIVKTIRAAFDIKPPPENRDFLKAAAGCLANMGKSGYEALIYALDSKILKPQDRQKRQEVEACMRVREFVVEALGVSKDQRALKPLFKLLQNDEARVIRAACKAFTHFDKLSLNQRKTVAKELIKVYSYLHVKADEDPMKPEHREKLMVVEVAFNNALMKMTHQHFESAPEWEKWYNNNKGKPNW